MSILSLTVSGGDIGSWILLGIGVILAVAIGYALMRLLNSPPWMYTVAAIVGLIILLLIVVAFFFDGSGGPVRIGN